MQNEIYCKTVVPANESPDGESPTLVIVTQEANGYAVWVSGHDEGTRLTWFNRDRDRAIERGVELGKKTPEALAAAIVNAISLYAYA